MRNLKTLIPHPSDLLNKIVIALFNVPRSKSSRRDESPYGVKSIVPSRDPSPSITRSGADARKQNQRKTYSSPSPAPAAVKVPAKTRQSKSSPPSAPSAGKNIDVKNKG